MPDFNEVGYEEESEEFIDDISGRKRKGRRRKSRGKQIQQNAYSGRKAPSTGLRPFGLGFVTLAVGNQTDQVSATVQEAIEVVRPVIDVTYDSLYAGGIVVVTDVKVGIKSQMAGTESFPASAFEPRADGIALRGDIATPGSEITIIFGVSAAITAGNAYISAMILGLTRG